MTTEPDTPPYILLARYCQANPDRSPNDAAVILGLWDLITAQHSPADLRPVRVRGERRRRRAG